MATMIANGAAASWDEDPALSVAQQSTEHAENVKFVFDILDDIHKIQNQGNSDQSQGNLKWVVWPGTAC